MNKKSLLLAATMMFLVGGFIGLWDAKATSAKENEVEVLVGTFRDFTGPTSSAANKIWKIFDWHLAWLEQNDPIKGVKVKILWEDTAYSAERFVPAYKRFKAAGAVVMIHCSSTANSVLGELHREDKIPAITPGCGYPYGFFPRNVKKKGPSVSLL